MTLRPTDFDVLITSVIAGLCIALLVILISAIANASDYAAPDLSEYYASLMQPDNPGVSCCGWADAYQCVEDQDENGALVCVITDTRPDTRTLPDGRVINRPHKDVGTRVYIPPQKIRKHPIFNPTDHALVFMSMGGSVYCYEPVSLI